ncbi:CybS-domain-containing protein, partial [Phakopsora pachyrhizi]
YVKGSISDPTPIPMPNKTHGSIHWNFERALLAALVPVTAATAVSSPNPLLDGVLGVVLVLHSHMGFDQL